MFGTKIGLASKGKFGLKDLSDFASIGFAALVLGGLVAIPIHWFLLIIREKLFNEGFGIFDRTGELWVWASALLLTAPILIAGHVMFIKSLHLKPSPKSYQVLGGVLVCSLVFAVNGLSYFSTSYGHFLDNDSVIMVRQGALKKVRSYHWQEIKSAAVLVSHGYGDVGEADDLLLYNLRMKDGNLIKLQETASFLYQLGWQNVPVTLASKGFPRDETDSEIQYIESNSWANRTGIIIHPGNEANGIGLRAFDAWYDRDETANIIFSLTDKIGKRLDKGVKPYCQLDTGVGATCDSGVFYKKMQTVSFLVESKGVKLTRGSIVRLRISHLSVPNGVINGPWEATVKFISGQELLEVNNSEISYSGKIPFRIDRILISPVGITLNTTENTHQELARQFPDVRLKLVNDQNFKVDAIAGGRINNHRIYNYQASGLLEPNMVRAVIIDGIECRLNILRVGQLQAE